MSPKTIQHVERYSNSDVLIGDQENQPWRDGKLSSLSRNSIAVLTCLESATPFSQCITVAGHEAHGRHDEVYIRMRTEVLGQRARRIVKDNVSWVFMEGKDQ